MPDYVFFLLKQELMKKFQLFRILFVMLVIGVAPVCAMAQGYDTSAVKEAPHYFEEMSEEEFIENSRLVKEEPDGQKSLSYKIRIPDGWSKVDSSRQKKGDDLFSMNRSIIGTIAKYYGPSDIMGGSRFEIEAQTMDHDMTAKNWLLNHLLQSGYTLQGMTEYSDYRVEVVYVALEKDTPYIVRTMAHINGRQIILASHYLPDRYWNKDRAQQDYVISSFELTNKEATTIEVNHTYEVLDLLKFDYPSSWQLMSPRIYDISGIDIVLLNSPDGRNSNGEITLHLISTELDTTLSEEVEFFRNELEEARGVEIGDLISSPDHYNFPAHTYYDKVEVYSLKGTDIKLIDYEYWVAIMAEDRYYYIIEMLTPSRNVDFYNWARNTETFEVVIQSLRPSRLH